MTRNVKRAIASKLEEIVEIDGRILYHQRALATTDKIKNVFGAGDDLRGVAVEVTSVPSMAHDVAGAITEKVMRAEIVVTVAFRDSEEYEGSTVETFDSLLDNIVEEFAEQETIVLSSGTAVTVGAVESINDISIVEINGQLCQEATIEIECYENEGV